VQAAPGAGGVAGAHVTHVTPPTSSVATALGHAIAHAGTLPFTGLSLVWWALLALVAGLAGVATRKSSWARA
jgi:hypothetical protein